MSAATLDRSAAATGSRLNFHLPPELEAREPAEARGLRRDGVRMLVAERSSGRLTHARFGQLPTYLDAGDLVVINTSAVIPAALRAATPDGRTIAVHLSTQLGPTTWVVEPREVAGRSSRRWSGARPPELLDLGGDATLRLLEPYLSSTRLWIAELSLPTPTPEWLAAHGQPIRYEYVEQPWPIDAYQNVYATEPGSAEMPSAGRPFTTEVITDLVVHGVGVTPVVLHTGVASLEADELPYPEHVVVSPTTAARVNATHEQGGRVIAVGTTAVRALETASDPGGVVAPFDGWTDLVITPARGVATVDGLITGWHEPEASHLLMLEAIAGRELLEASYAASLEHRYLWHEFGDIHLILP